MVLNNKHVAVSITISAVNARMYSKVSLFLFPRRFLFLFILFVFHFRSYHPFTKVLTRIRAHILYWMTCFFHDFSFAPVYFLLPSLQDFFFPISDNDDKIVLFFEYYDNHINKWIKMWEFSIQNWIESF